MPKPQKTEKELSTLIRKMWGSPINVTIVPGKHGYWNVLPLRTTPSATLESQQRFEDIIASLREDFDLKG